MRTLLPLALTVAVVAPACAQDDPKAVIAKAVAAHGGAGVLDQFIAGRVQTKGTIAFQGAESQFSRETVYQVPDRVRTTVEVVTMGQRRTVTHVFNGFRASMFVGTFAQQVPNAQIEEMKTALYVRDLTRLTPLQKEGRFKLTALGEKAIEEKPAVGVRVTSEGHKDVSLYFDKATSLLVMLERAGFDAQGKPAEQQEYYSDYREASGLKYPTRTVVRQGGKKYVETETVVFKPLERVDPKEFANIP